MCSARGRRPAAGGLKDIMLHEIRTLLVGPARGWLVQGRNSLRASRAGFRMGEAEPVPGGLWAQADGCCWAYRVCCSSPPDRWHTLAHASGNYFVPAVRIQFQPRSTHPRSAGEQPRFAILRCLAWVWWWGVGRPAADDPCSRLRLPLSPSLISSLCSCKGMDGSGSTRVACAGLGREAVQGGFLVLACVFTAASPGEGTQCGCCTDSYFQGPTATASE